MNRYRALACVLAIYGLATVAHGSGFLAVFVAGILIGDERAPYKREIEGFHSIAIIIILTRRPDAVDAEWQDVAPQWQRRHL